MQDPISAKGISYVTLTTGNSFSVYLKLLQNLYLNYLLQVIYIQRLKEFKVQAKGFTSIRSNIGNPFSPYRILHIYIYSVDIAGKTYGHPVNPCKHLQCSSKTSSQKIKQFFLVYMYINRQAFAFSNVVIIRCHQWMDVLSDPFFEQGFKDICCLSFFYILWYHIV